MMCIALEHGLSGAEVWMQQSVIILSYASAKHLKVVIGRTLARSGLDTKKSDICCTYVTLLAVMPGHLKLFH